MESKLTNNDFSCYSPDTEIKVFSPTDDACLQDALKLARELKSKKQFTDVSSFAI